MEPTAQAHPIARISNPRRSPKPYFLASDRAYAIGSPFAVDGGYTFPDLRSAARNTLGPKLREQLARRVVGPDHVDLAVIHGPPE
jgi:hypothetical protein